MNETLTFGKIIVEITHPEKVLFPNGTTKGDLIDYYNTIAPWMIPYVEDRPLMMQRFPDGINGESFYQKDASAYFPSWIKQVEVPKIGGYNNYVVCQNQATLVYLANQACITPHVWLSKVDKLDYPDEMIFDLDPSEGATFRMVCEIALSLKKLLEEIGLHPYVKTTGSHGLHVTIPLDQTHTFDEVKAFAQACARLIIEREPKLATLEIRKAKRAGKIFIDTLRNQYAATAVAPYAVRPHPAAPVATPLFWDELSNKKLTAQSFTIKNIFARLKSESNAWQGFKKHARNSGKVIERGLPS